MPEEPSEAPANWPNWLKNHSISWEIYDWSSSVVTANNLRRWCATASATGEPASWSACWAAI
ncbi:MAG: hypothetical protein ACRD82_20920 [Blastocatellia bacterium]